MVVFTVNTFNKQNEHQSECLVYCSKLPYSLSFVINTMKDANQNSLSKELTSEIRGAFMTYATSNIEFFPKIFNDSQPSLIVPKSSILNKIKQCF